MSLKILVIVPCGSSKIWDKFPKSRATRAEEVYIGAPFKVNKAFARNFADKWVILSAKYGLIEPNFIIPENYDISFNDPTTNPISLGELKAQAKENFLEDYDVVIVLGGKRYTEIVKKVFSMRTKVIAPTEGLPIGKAMNLTKSLMQVDKRQMLKKIS